MNILLVHDQTQELRTFTDVIRALRMEVDCVVAHSITAAQQILHASTHFDAAMLDLNFVGLDGARQLKERHPNLKLLAFEFPPHDVNSQTGFAHIMLGLSTIAGLPRTGGGKARPEDLAMKCGAQDARRLTRRELDVVCLIRDGLPNKSIASILGITEGTVKVYARAIFRKLGVSNRTQAAMSADALLGVMGAMEAAESGFG